MTTLAVRLDLKDQLTRALRSTPATVRRLYALVDTGNGAILFVPSYVEMLPTRDENVGAQIRIDTGLAAPSVQTLAVLSLASTHVDEISTDAIVSRIVGALQNVFGARDMLILESVRALMHRATCIAILAAVYHRAA